MPRISRIRVVARLDDHLIITDEDAYRPADTALCLDVESAEELIATLRRHIDWLREEAEERAVRMREAVGKLDPFG